jgi:hypothetical protein
MRLLRLISLENEVSYLEVHGVDLEEQIIKLKRTGLYQEIAVYERKSIYMLLYKGEWIEI